ncbi:MAG: hypothetical protein R2877_01045 [Bdellovibrionota bacterium]
MFKGVIAGFLLLASTAYADISFKQARFFQLDQPYEISGAVSVGNEFYVVMDNRPVIYVLQGLTDNESSCSSH